MIPKNVRKPGTNARPPATVLALGAILALAIAGGVALVRDQTSARRPESARVDEESMGRLVVRQARELETLRRRVASLSARLANAGESCEAAGAQLWPLAVAARTADTSEHVDAGPHPEVTSAEPPTPPPALSTATGTETFLRELARSSAASLSLEQAVCSDDVCRLAVIGHGLPADDALTLQSFIGRTAEWLPRTLILPGAAGAATVVLLARPGHELPAALVDPPTN